MPLTAPDYNAFAEKLAARFVSRAKGQDEGSERLVGVRPADHVLCGFLTPAGRTETGKAQEDADESVATDLPQDSSYEQSAIGAEWLAPRKGLSASSRILVDVSFCVYVRSLPTYQEQKQSALWRNVKSEQANGDEPTGRVCDLVSVWTRHQLPPFQIDVPAGDLVSANSVSRSLSKAVSGAIADINQDTLYSARRVLSISEKALETESTFKAFLATSAKGTVRLAWNPVVDVRIVPTPAEPTCSRIALRLLNYSEEVDPRLLDFLDPNLYAVSIAVSLPSTAHRPTIFQELPSSFRYDRTMAAVGINSHVVLKQQSSDRLQLVIDSVPRTTVPRLEPREIPGVDPRFEHLAKDPSHILRRIYDDMIAYDRDCWSQKIKELTGLEKDEAEGARQRFRTEADDFLRGIELLENPAYASIRTAFTLMNDAMNSASTSFRSWRLFQLVFIVSELPRLASREFKELARDNDESVDILWFAAGGGKTEAFLGVILWQAFFDRLRGKKIGLTALVRFPLRLLTFQQLQRLGRAIGAAELLRVKHQLGGARFSLGYFVGNAVTPNSISDEMHSRFKSRGVEPRFQRIFQCLFCGSPVQLRYCESDRIIEHVCTANACPGGPGRLPLYIVDDDVYRFVPTVVVSTVDKLAQVGQNQRFSNLLGRVDFLCLRHGVSFKSSNKKFCPASVEWGAGERPSTCGDHRVEYGPFHDAAPALLVQDELHLLSEELGTFDAHYETGVIQLARSIGAIPWKVIAATATIEDYEKHAWQLYLRRARQFPGPGPGAYDSFYYRQNPLLVGRLFLGVLGVGRKHTPSVTRALSLLYLELQSARDMASSDLSSASREYGIRELTRQEFQYLVFLYELPLTYVLTRKGSDQVAEAIESRVRRELRELTPQHGELIVEMFNGGVDFGDMIAAMEKIRAADPASDPQERIRGLVTTNIIGHGVDVDRFNIMVFAGFTRLVAEYIQASARVGRTFPGISIFVPTPQSERDRSIFDRFAKFHEYLDRLVDPTAVNRWPEPALLRTVPGLLAGYLMGAAALRLGKPLATVEDVQHAYGRPGADALTEAEIVDWMEKAYGTGYAGSRYRERVRTYALNSFSSVVNTPPKAAGRPRNLNMHLSAMRSLRDVDDPAFITVEGDVERAIVKRLIHG